MEAFLNFQIKIYPTHGGERDGVIKSWELLGHLHWEASLAQGDLSRPEILKVSLSLILYHTQ